MHEDSSTLINQLASDVRSTPTDDTQLSIEEGSHADKELDRELKAEQIKTWRHYNETLSVNSEERKKYAGYIFKLTCIWALLIFLLIFLQGFNVTHLSDKVVITLITSTTINFFGFFLLVTKYLFNSNEHILSKSSNRLVKKPSIKTPKNRKAKNS